MSHSYQNYGKLNLKSYKAEPSYLVKKLNEHDSSSSRDGKKRYDDEREDRYEKPEKYERYNDKYYDKYKSMYYL